MVRKCSHCGNVGHNSRTCTMHKQKLRGRFKLFGVQLIDEASSSPPPPPSPSADAATASLLKKSISLDCLPSSSLSSLSPPSLSSSSFEKLSSGYLSDGLVTKTQERKKGVPWSEEEHRVFLVGLEKLGKGDWRGISRKFVTTRTPTQVASHAQKYFLRLTTLNKRKQRRTSLFDAAAGRDKLTVQVIDEGSNLKPTNLQPSSIYFGVIPSKKKPSNSTPIIQKIAKSNGSHSGIFALNLDNNKNHFYNSVLPINWFGYEDQPSFKFLQGPIIKSSSSIISGKQKKLSHLQAPDLQLQLSLSTPKPVEQAEPCCRSLAINGAISVT